MDLSLIFQVNFKKKKLKR